MFPVDIILFKYLRLVMFYIVRVNGFQNPYVKRGQSYVVLQFTNTYFLRILL